MISSMNTRAATAYSPQRHAHAVGARALATTIEWEELPAIAHTAIRHRERSSWSRTSMRPVWNVTAPMPMAPVATDVAPVPFREPLNGLHVREIEGAEVFDHFFRRR